MGVYGTAVGGGEERKMEVWDLDVMEASCHSEPTGSRNLALEPENGTRSTNSKSSRYLNLQRTTIHSARRSLRECSLERTGEAHEAIIIEVRHG